jgi:hypothetical protein
VAALGTVAMTSRPSAGHARISCVAGPGPLAQPAKRRGHAPRGQKPQLFRLQQNVGREVS